MLVVGELNNTSRQAIRRAVEARDAGYIRQVAQARQEGGANYSDINCGTMLKDEVPVMEWLVNTVQEVSDLPLCIDSPSAQALEATTAGLGASGPGSFPTKSQGGMENGVRNQSAVAFFVRPGCTPAPDLSGKATLRPAVAGKIF